MRHPSTPDATCQRYVVAIRGVKLAVPGLWRTACTFNPQLWIIMWIEYGDARRGWGAACG